MNKELKLYYYKDNILEGFRCNYPFIQKHRNTLDMISDEIWRKNEFMNIENNISSPTRSILGRYICNILSALFIDIANGKINKIVVICNSKKKIDPYSKLIFSIIEEVTFIRITFTFFNETYEYPSISKEKMRTNIKRGFYDRFNDENRELLWIYNFFRSIFYGNPLNIDSLINKYKEVSDEYSRWLLLKAIINLGIRQQKKEIVEIFLKKLKYNNQGNFDYLNSYSFYLLKFYSKETCKQYLEKNINIEDFLKSEEPDFAESLVLKNYSSLLHNTSKLKRPIMQKCLSHTPQDVDLWKEWFRCFATQQEVRDKSAEIFRRGYSDIELINFLEIKSDDIDGIIRIIILCNTHSNRQIARHLANYIQNNKLKTIMLNFIGKIDLTDIMEKGEYDTNY